MSYAEDLAKQLEEGTDFFAESSLYFNDKLALACSEAAEELIRLQKEVDRLTTLHLEELTRLRAEVCHWQGARQNTLEAGDILKAENDRLRAENEALRAKYNDLILSVGNKWPGESRHETAKRYIHQAERSICNQADAARAALEKEKS